MYFGNLSIKLFIIVIPLLFSCHSEPSSASNSSPAPSVSSGSVEMDAQFVQHKPLSANAIRFYTNLIWHYEAAIVINKPEKNKDYIGKWIKFNPDQTLETGFYEGPVSKGKWVLDESNNRLTILEKGSHPTYSEWNIKTSSSSDAVMVWVGTKRFGLNNTQIKMQRNNEKPQK